jgi:hypothetical protein
MRTLLCLTMLFGLSWTDSSRADLPAALKPADTNAFWCTDRKGAVAVANQFDENADSHKQIKDGSGGLSTIELVLILVLTGAAGYEAHSLTSSH